MIMIQESKKVAQLGRISNVFGMEEHFEIEGRKNVRAIKARSI